jgi:hypothetical protein
MLRGNILDILGQIKCIKMKEKLNIHYAYIAHVSATIFLSDISFLSISL